MNGETAQTRNRRQIWLLIGLFFAPLAVAFILYYGIDGWRPPGNTNHGDLVTPPRPLPELTLPVVSGNVAQDFLRGKWTLFYAGDGRCDARCREALTLMRQTRLALNDDMGRIQRVFVATEHCCDQSYLDNEHAGLVIVRADDAGGKEFLGSFPRYNAVPVAQSGRIYIVDPLGNLMMSYAATAHPNGLLQDLKKLLKLSHIG